MTTSFSNLVESSLKKLCAQKRCDSAELRYKQFKAIDDGGNDDLEVDTLLVLQHFAFAIGGFYSHASIVEREGRKYVLDTYNLTESQQKIISGYWEDKKLSPLNNTQDILLVHCAVQALCFQGLEYLPTPIQLSNSLIRLGENLVVLDVLRTGYRSVQTPSKRALIEGITPDSKLSNVTISTPTVETLHENLTLGL